MPRHLRSVTLLAFSTLFAQEKPKGLCAVSGNVVDSLTGAPLAKAEVHLEPVNGRWQSVWPATLTDAKGNFAFAKLDPGEYHLGAERLGYLTSYYGSKRAEQRGPTVSLSASDDLTNLIIRMLPQAVISGAVRESDGEPAPNVAVNLFHWVYQDGRHHYLPVRFTRTDDVGQYRFPNVPPGRYDVETRDNFGGQHPLVDRSAEGSPHLLVRLPARRSGVEVKAGERISGVDLTMTRGNVYRIAGKVIVGGGTLSDLQLRRTGDFFTVRTHPAPGGQFEFGMIPPGSYNITTEDQVDGGILAVDVVDHDVEGLTLSVEPGCPVSGRIVWEGSARPTLHEPALIFNVALWYRYLPNANSPFKLRLGRDRYALLANPYPAREWALKSARVGDTDLLADGLTIAGCREMAIDLTLTTELGRVEGTAMGANGKPAAAATVALIPASKLRTRWELFDSVTADANGHFLIKGIIPGDYTIHAWDDVEPEAWRDPEFLKQYETSSETVTVNANQTSNATIKCH